MPARIFFVFSPEVLVSGPVLSALSTVPAMVLSISRIAARTSLPAFL